MTNLRILFARNKTLKRIINKNYLVAILDCSSAHEISCPKCNSTSYHLNEIKKDIFPIELRFYTLMGLWLRDPLKDTGFNYCFKCNYFDETDSFNIKTTI